MSPDAILGKITFPDEGGCDLYIGIQRPDESGKWAWQELGVVRLTNEERLQLVSHLATGTAASVIEDAPRVP